jgi:hypothetical protein
LGARDLFLPTPGIVFFPLSSELLQLHREFSRCDCLSLFIGSYLLYLLDFVRRDHPIQQQSAQCFSGAVPAETIARRTCGQTINHRLIVAKGARRAPFPILKNRPPLLTFSAG